MLAICLFMQFYTMKEVYLSNMIPFIFPGATFALVLIICGVRTLVKEEFHEEILDKGLFKREGGEFNRIWTSSKMSIGNVGALPGT